MSSKTVDIYLPLDARDAPNRTVWPVATMQLAEIVKVVEKWGWEANVLTPRKPVSSVAEGVRVVREAKGERFIDFMAGWAYPDFSVTPMWQLPAETPKLLLGSSIPDFPGAVGLLAAASGTAHVGLKTSRLYVEDFADHASYEDAIASFLRDGTYVPGYPTSMDVPVTDRDRELARTTKAALRGQVYGVIGPRSMQMWNKISEADF